MPKLSWAQISFHVLIVLSFVPLRTLFDGLTRFQELGHHHGRPRGKLLNTG